MLWGGCEDMWRRRSRCAMPWWRSGLCLIQAGCRRLDAKAKGDGPERRLLLRSTASSLTTLMGELLLRKCCSDISLRDRAISDQRL